MAMDNRIHSLFGEAIQHGLLVHIHDVHRFLRHRGGAVLAQTGRDLLSFGKRFGEKPGLPGGAAHEFAEGLVVVIVGAQRIAVD